MTKNQANSPVADRRLITFLDLAKKCNRKKAPPVSRRCAVPCVARTVRPPHKLARSAMRPRAQTYSSEFPDRPPLLGGAQGREMQKVWCALRARFSFCHQRSSRNAGVTQDLLDYWPSIVISRLIRSSKSSYVIIFARRFELIVNRIFFCSCVRSEDRPITTAPSAV